MQSPAVVSGSFVSTVQFEKLEIHTVFLRFSNFHLCQNLSLTTLADWIIGYPTGLRIARGPAVFLVKRVFADFLTCEVRESVIK